MSLIAGGNICLHPHEEIIRFLNKYVRKRVSPNEFADIKPNLDSTTASLDLGCGMGRHVELLDEFQLNPYGIDLSDTAIEFGKQWFDYIGKKDLGNRLIVGSVADMPFEDNFFDICVSHGVLDSMPRDIARLGMQEVHRVLKKDALMYFDLIMDTNRPDGDEIVDSGYEKDTIQSYFTVDSIKEFIGNDFEILQFKIVTWTDEMGLETSKRAHLIIRKNKGSK